MRRLACVTKPSSRKTATARIDEIAVKRNLETSQAYLKFWNEGNTE